MGGRAGKPLRNQDGISKGTLEPRFEWPMLTVLRLPTVLVLVLVGALFAAAPAAGHQDEDCAGVSDIPYDIDLVVDIPPSRVHHDRSIEQLGGMVAHGPGARVLGAANAGLEFGWGMDMQSVRSGGKYCVWVARLRLTVRYPSPDIYIAREYRKGSCQYRTILAHEQEHVQISRATIKRYLPRLHLLLTSLRIPTAQRPIRTATLEQAEEDLSALMRDLVDPVYREMARALTSEQASLDSPASYRRLFRRCRDW
jgi:hypothetical protein